LSTDTPKVRTKVDIFLKWAKFFDEDGSGKMQMEI
jgi:hypothetical protein